MTTILRAGCVTGLLLLSGCGWDNESPVASSLDVTIDEDTFAEQAFPATDADDDSLRFEILTQPRHGTLSPRGDQFLYSPDPDYNGADSFVFRARDVWEKSAPATVSITIRPVNDEPTVTDVVTTTPEDQAVTFTVLMDDVDGDATSLSAGDTSGDGVYDILDATAGIVRYTPRADFNGQARASFQVSDGTTSVWAATNVTVTPVNDAPVAVDDIVRTQLATPVDSIVVNNDEDIDDPPLTLVVRSVSTTPAGQVTIDNGSIRFAPAPNFLGAATVTYVVADAAGATSAANITFEVVLPRPIFFLADHDTPGKPDLFRYDGLATQPVNAPLGANERIIDFKLGGAPLYRTRDGFTSRLYRNPRELFGPPGPGRISLDAHSVDDYGFTERTYHYLANGTLFTSLLNPLVMFTPPAPGEHVTRVLDNPIPVNVLFLGTLQFNPALGQSTLRMLAQDPPFNRYPPILTLNAPDQVTEPLLTLSPPGRVLDIAFNGEIGGVRALYSMSTAGSPAIPVRLSPAFGLGENFFNVQSSPNGTAVTYRANVGGSAFNVYRVDLAAPGAHVQLNHRTSSTEELGLHSFDGDWSNLYYLLSNAAGNDRLVYRASLSTPGAGTPVSASTPNTYGAYDLVVRPQGDALLYVRGATAAGPSRLVLVNDPAGAPSERTLRDAGTVIENLRMANDGSAALFFDRFGTLWLVNLRDDASLSPVYVPPAGTDGVSEARFAPR